MMRPTDRRVAPHLKSMTRTRVLPKKVARTSVVAGADTAFDANTFYGRRHRDHPACGPLLHVFDDALQCGTPAVSFSIEPALGMAVQRASARHRQGPCRVSQIGT